MLISNDSISTVVRLMYLAGQLSVSKRQKRTQGEMILIAAAEHLLNPKMSSRKTTIQYDNEKSML